MELLEIMSLNKVDHRYIKILQQFLFVDQIGRGCDRQKVVPAQRINWYSPNGAVGIDANRGRSMWSVQVLEGR